VTTLRLLSYNIRSLRDDEDAVTRTIRAAAAHVVTIQEAPRFLRWRSTAARIARRSGMVVVTGGRTAAANLVLCTLEVSVHSTSDVLFTKDRRLHQRGAAIAVLELGGHRFAVAGTHLDLVAEARLRHVIELHEALDRFVPSGCQVIVAGDMNDDPGSAVWRRLAERGVDVWPEVPEGAGFTSSATNPVRRIDAIFADRDIRILKARVLDEPDVLIASDHRPLLVELELQAPDHHAEQARADVGADHRANL
jgi:endonuclease/exonuclease/phosphatase family metal-dependent hydrolase